MRLPVPLTLALILYTGPNLLAERIFYDNFENQATTNNAWEPGAGELKWELSLKHNHTPGGRTSIKIEPKRMQVWEEFWHALNKPKPAHVRVWFYERGWKNKIKVDQQYILIGDGTTELDSLNFCQIGQTGNPEHDGHYSIFDQEANAWFHTETATDEPRWVKIEFVLSPDGAARILVDDKEEYAFTSKWQCVGTVGLASYGNEDRGGIIDGYWDDVEVFNTEEAPDFSVSSRDKLSALWGGIKLIRHY